MKSMHDLIKGNRLEVCVVATDAVPTSNVITEMFQVSVGLAELYLDLEDDIAPGSTQPVVLTNEQGERQIEIMRWGFKLADRFLFNARSEGIDTTKFWGERFKTGRCAVPADSFFEWVKAAKRSKTEI